MKHIRHTIITAIAAIATLITACTADNDMPETNTPKVSPVSMRISVSEMTLEPVSSRALQPMSPDVEKYVRTMAIFEFDNEGIHDKDYGTTYHFLDFLKGTIDGVYNDKIKTEYGIVETTIDNLKFIYNDDDKNNYSNGTICVVANVTEDQVEEFYQKCMKENDSGGELKYGRVMLSYFKTWSLPFEYKEPEAGKYDETESGHLENMYMFGYYQGEIAPDKDIPVDLGRLASRIDITIKNKTGEDITKRLGYHFDNVCSSAYFFPIKMSIPPTIGVGTTRTVICTGIGTPLQETVKTEVPEKFLANATHTRYFYLAAHSAKSKDEATKIDLFWNSKIIDTCTPEAGGTHIQIPLCNIHPDQAGEVENGYSLSRNTRYHFTINIKKGTPTSKQASTTSQPNNSTTPQARAITDPANPYEITVYIP